MTERVLIVEDEPKLAALLSDYLRAAHYETRCVGDGREVVPAVRESPPDLVLLDLMLPGRDGLEVCRDLRTFTQVPIVMVTARVEEIDRLLGLELGADDYICKPFSPREVVARVKAILRRARRSPETGSEGGSEGGPAIIAAPIFSIDEERYVAAYHGHTLDLTPVEFRLLKTLADSRGRVLSRQQLLDRLYTDHRIVNDRTVDSHIRNLRRKLQAVTPADDPIQSIYGIGYKWVPE